MEHAAERHKKDIPLVEDFPLAPEKESRTTNGFRALKKFTDRLLSPFMRTCGAEVQSRWNDGPMWQRRYRGERPPLRTLSSICWACDDSHRRVDLR